MIIDLITRALERMEKIKTKKSSDIPNDCTTFKLHLSFIEKDWLSRYALESYQSSNGNYFSYIFQSSGRM